LKIAKKLEEDGHSYRIITPYDAQRSLIEDEMKVKKLQWEDKCFNVDSFQGVISLFLRSALSSS
jgi:superfamily I DNA and/or RNA helicase